MMKNKKACIAAGLAVFGSPTWTRTRDLRINSREAGNSFKAAQIIRFSIDLV